MRPCNILMEIKGSPMLRRPKPIKTPANLRDKKKYCEYHEGFGHTTAECKKPFMRWLIEANSVVF